jgi:hypothetical protein
MSSFLRVCQRKWGNVGVGRGMEMVRDGGGGEKLNTVSFRVFMSLLESNRFLFKQEIIIICWMGHLHNIYKYNQSILIVNIGSICHCYMFRSEASSSSHNKRIISLLKRDR